MSALERVEGALAGMKLARVVSRDGMPLFEIAPADAHEACRRLRDEAGFETNTFITAIDRFPAEPRFEVYWQFLSLAHNDRVRLVTRIGERANAGARSVAGGDQGMGRHLGDSVLLETRPSGASVVSSDSSLAVTPAPGAVVDSHPLPLATSVPSIVDLYPGAAYSERECYDMFGIVFDGHAKLQRLLMPEDYGHFPLRKDFPHQGIEPDRLYREWDAKRHRARVEPAPTRESVP